MEDIGLIQSYSVIKTKIFWKGIIKYYTMCTQIRRKLSVEKRSFGKYDKKKWGISPV